MNFKKYLLIISVFSLSQGIIVHAQKSELATSSQQSNINKESDAFWSNNLCRKYTPKGNLDVVRPFAAALKACPERKDYGQTVEAYKKFDKAYIRLQDSKGSLQNGDNILRDSDGEAIIAYDGSTAATLCKPHGKRLPTLRELAIEATKYGARILELSQAQDMTVPVDFKLVTVMNPDGMVDKFYYSLKYYDKPEKVKEIEERNYLIWSSSSVSGGQYFVLNNYSGGIHHEGFIGTFRAVTRCIDLK